MARPFLPSYASAWLDSETSIKRWVGRMDAATFRTYYSRIYRFFQSIQKTPDEAVAWARENSGNGYGELLDAIQDYVLGEDLRHGTKHLTYCALRSFFTHQRVLLPVDRSFRIHSSKQPVERKITPATFRELVMLEPRTEP